MLAKDIDKKRSFPLQCNVLFYTDTNGHYPPKPSVALRILENIMENTPLNKIDFEQFHRVADMIDQIAALDPPINL